MKQLMINASKAYYDGKPFLTNEQYDSLERIYGQIISGNGDTPHAYRLYSLKKHYEKDGVSPIPKEVCVETPKLDGAAVSCLYIDGNLVHCLTRGNGIKGRDITTKMELLDIPKNIPISGVVQVTGEVVANKDMDNSRNYASGALNLKDLSEYSNRVLEGSMKFIAYNIQVKEGSWGLKNTYTEDMELLRSFGFNSILSDISWDETYPIDGTVYRINSNKEFNEAGFTDKFPRGAYALKEEQEGIVTTLLDVVWQTGKSGKVSPIAILEPIRIGEATIARATLNNMAFIEAMDLEIGCRVEVIRSGEIIPCIVGRVD